MPLLDIILLAFALAMDCFAVSTTSGVLLRRWEWGVILRIAVLFGLFQAAMPLIGWGATVHFSHYIRAYDHWLAFALLAFLGGRMILGGIRGSEQPAFNPRSLTIQLLLSVATSIDALAVGVTFAATGYDTISSLTLPLLAIGIASLLMSLIGHTIGISFGAAVAKRIKPDILGGIILIAIGLKILISHLTGE